MESHQSSLINKSIEEDNLSIKLSELNQNENNKKPKVKKEKSLVINDYENTSLEQNTVYNRRVLAAPRS